MELFRSKQTLQEALSLALCSGPQRIELGFGEINLVVCDFLHEYFVDSLLVKRMELLSLCTEGSKVTYDGFLHFGNCLLSLFCNLFNFVGVFVDILQDLSAERVIDVQEFRLLLITAEPNTLVKALSAL